jgi:predicted ATP-dependent endonuclease of OLD family
MYLKKFQIKNFKSFQNISIELNKDINILTGVNNSGKTTMLEAIALWHECFSKLLQIAQRGTKNYAKGDYVLGNTGNKYFPYQEINSVRAPNFEDIFYQRIADNKKKIELRCLFENNENEELSIDFFIGQSGLNYVIELEGNRTYNYTKFNNFFKNFPNPIGIYYASPVSAIGQNEKFVTFPQIQDAILNRQSSRVFRNRLFHLYNSDFFQEFERNLNYVLFNNQQKIILSSESKINTTVNVVFNFKIGERDTKKDISLLGSGTLQVMEILLNFYSENGKKDCNLVLLDEPDSHIHRAIQQRLLLLLTRFTQNSQVFLSTHNEALIRSASVEQLFHLEANPVKAYQSLVHQNLKKQTPHFKGMYPALINPIISSLGYSNGLDFINAIEADYVIFVEGEDDARAIDILLREGINNNTKRYAYWILNGVDNILKEILHYKPVFSLIKNEKPLWEKAVLFFDRDYLYDELLFQFSDRLNGKGVLGNKDVEWQVVKIPTHVWKAYTFESILFSDLKKLSKLLHQWLAKKSIDVTENEIETKLRDVYSNMKSQLETTFNEDFYIKEASKQDSIIKKINETCEKPTITTSSHQVNSNIRLHIQKCLDNQEYYKLMKKEDAASVINECVSNFSISYDKNDFISLIQCVDKSIWFDDWDVLTKDLR